MEAFKDFQINAKNVFGGMVAATGGSAAAGDSAGFKVTGRGCTADGYSYVDYIDDDGKQVCGHKTRDVDGKYLCD